MITRRLYLLYCSILTLFACGCAYGVSISDVKTVDDGTPVVIESAIVSATINGDAANGGFCRNSFGIEQSDRSCGIRVLSSELVKPGDKVDISGVAATVDGERVIRALSVNILSSNNPYSSPLAMQIKHVCGGAIGNQGAVIDNSSLNQYASGINSVGMLVTVYGKVTASVDTGDYSGYFYVDDGSGTNDGSGNLGMKCAPASWGVYPQPLPLQGDFVIVQGIAGVESFNGNNARKIWTKNVQQVNAPSLDSQVSAYSCGFGNTADIYGQTHTFVTYLDGLSNPSASYTVSTNSTYTSIVVKDARMAWRGYAPIGAIGGAVYSNWKLYGGERIRLTYSFSPSGASAQTNISLQMFGGDTITLAGASDLVMGGKVSVLDVAIPSIYAGKQVAALWVTLHNPRPNGSTLNIYSLELVRDTSINNRLDADAILSNPPVCKASIGMQNGVPGIFVDNQPITGLGWSSMIQSNVGDQEVSDLTGLSGLKCHRLVFALGEQCYILPPYYAPTWLGPNLFDFSSLDQQMSRITSASSDSKVILLVCLDGARWWVKRNPLAAGIESSIGVPDYLSPEWRRDARDAVRQMIAHVASSSYANRVIGYELFNGSTLDCNFETNDSTPSALARFRTFLKSKYGSVANLQSAWGRSDVTFANAVPQTLLGTSTPNDPMALLLDPHPSVAYMDSAHFRSYVYQQTILDFARWVKEATCGYALVGARMGDFCGNQGYFAWQNGWADNVRMDMLAKSPDFDFFDVQESYTGRNNYALLGSGTPVAVAQGLALRNKLVIIQNDWRTHTGGDMGYGATPNMEFTRQVQRRVLINSIVMGLYPYLWQMDYHYNLGDGGSRDLTLVNDFVKHQEIFKKALKTDRRTGAEVAYVFDTNYSNYFGYDPVYSYPSRAFALFDYPQHAIARAGVPYDMIFLDQIESIKPYKVYVFVMCTGLNSQQIDMIHRVLKSNNSVGIFVWADGLIGDRGISVNGMSDLTGMNIEMLTESRSWKMSPSIWFEGQTGVTSSTPIGTLKNYAITGESDKTFSPTFRVADSNSVPIAYFNGTTDVGVAFKQMDGWKSIYVASANVVPSIIRYAVSLAGAFQYTNSEEINYINNSFVGFHTSSTCTITVNLPSATALYDVFNDVELPAASTHNISVQAYNAYLFYRGTRAQWTSLGN